MKEEGGKKSRASHLLIFKLSGGHALRGFRKSGVRRERRSGLGLGFRFRVGVRGWGSGLGLGVQD